MIGLWVMWYNHNDEFCVCTIKDKYTKQHILVDNGNNDVMWFSVLLEPLRFPNFFLRSGHPGHEYKQSYV